MPAEVFDQVIATVLTGTANVARTAIRQFRTQGAGRLVIIGSLPGKIATPTYPQAANYVRRGARPPPPIASPGLFDVLVGPLMHVAGLTRVRVTETTGAVFEPRAEGDALRGGLKWHRRSADAVTKETDMGAEFEGAEVVRDIEASAQDVWAVLCDGWAYASWVVGTARIRAVDAGWPEQGTRLQHSFGVWPALIDDDTEVLSADPPHELMLKARGWPAGEAHVRLVLTPDGPSRTRVRIIEDAVAGPGVLVPRPVRQALIVWRNTEALRRLAYLAEGNIQSAGAR